METGTLMRTIASELGAVALLGLMVLLAVRISIAERRTIPSRIHPVNRR